MIFNMNDFEMFQIVMNCYSHNGLSAMFRITRISLLKRAGARFLLRDYLFLLCLLLD